jgi:FRG domain-containing protein
MEERAVGTWEQFKRQLADLRKLYDPESAEGWPLLFRGQANSCWSLATTLDRNCQRMPFREYYRLIGKIKPQIESLTDRDWPTADFPDVEKRCWDYGFGLDFWSGRCPGYAYMVYLRHHGFPSPLLDWTRSPHIASFFAFNSASTDQQGNVAIFVPAHTGQGVHGSGIPTLWRQGPNVKTHRRHFIQQSEYTLCMVFDEEWLFEKYETVFNEGRHQQGLCWKFLIPAHERAKVLTELDQYNVNALSLFGSEESIMDTLATREFSLASRQNETVLEKTRHG